MKEYIVFGMTTLCVLAASAMRPAQAQPRFGNGPLTISYGSYIPNSNTSRDDSDPSAYHASYVLAHSTNREALVYLDYFQSASEGGERNRIVGVGVGRKIYIGNTVSHPTAFYYSGGLGVYRVHGANIGDGFPVRTQDTTEGGARVSTGLELRRGALHGFTFEIGYTYLPRRVAGVSEGGFFNSIGIRF